MPELWVGDRLRSSRLCCSRLALCATAHYLQVVVAAVAVAVAAVVSGGLGPRVVQRLHDGKGGSTARRGLR
jgi:hypothetical protein